MFSSILNCTEYSSNRHFQIVNFLIGLLIDVFKKKKQKNMGITIKSLSF